MTLNEVLYITTIIPFVYLLSVLFLKLLLKLYNTIDLVVTKFLKRDKNEENNM